MEPNTFPSLRRECSCGDMTATDLYDAMRVRFPDAPAVCIQTSAQTSAKGEVLTAYSIVIYSTPISTNPAVNIVSHRGYGYTVQEALNDLRPVVREPVQDVEPQLFICDHAGNHMCYDRCPLNKEHESGEVCGAGPYCPHVNADVRCIPVADGKEG